MDENNKKEKEENEQMKAKESRCEESPPAQTITTYVAVPPDGGWGWVIVAASFMCNVVVDGIVFSFGVLLNDISKDFNISIPKCAIAGSLLSGFYLIAGPFVSAIANRYGFRVTGIAGSVLASFTFAISSLAPNIEYLWLVYGVLGGIGFGMIYVPAVITTGFYFEKWRALATGISVTGSGIGTIIMGPITKKLINHFSWRGALLIQAGVVLTCVLFSALYRPLKPIHVSVSNAETEETEEKTQLPLLQRIKVARDQLRKADSTVSIENEVGITAVQPTDLNKFLKANNNITYPTAAEVLHASSNETLSKSQDSLKMKEYLMNKDNKAKSEKRVSITACPEISIKIDKNHSDDCENLKEYEVDDELLSEHNNDEVFNTSKKQNKSATSTILGSDVRRDSITIKYRPRTTSDSSYRSRRNTLTKIEAGVRPLYRDDIFFQASLNRLPQFKSHGSGLDYTMSVTRLPTSKDVQEEEEAKCQLCPEAVRRTLATMLDMSLLRSPTFILFASAGFFTMMGLFVPFMYLADRAVGNGMDPELAVYLLSSIGITNTIGRIVSGAITSMPGMSSLVINNIALTIGGIATMISGLSDTPAYQFTFAAVFGLSISCFASLRSILVVDLIGLEKLTNAFGLLLLFQGVAAAIGSPIAGMFKELTDSYDSTFYISGGLILLSGVMCYPLNYLKRWEENRSAKQANEGANS
ncbi:monocarboxylate transporter 5 isoform X2 [Rhodnius prolixus]